MKTLALASLMLAVVLTAGCCGLPRLRPPVLRLDHESAFIYDTLTEAESFCL